MLLYVLTRAQYLQYVVPDIDWGGLLIVLTQWCGEKKKRPTHFYTALHVIVAYNSWVLLSKSIFSTSPKGLCVLSHYIRLSLSPRWFVTTDTFSVATAVGKAAEGGAYDEVWQRVYF